jgi:hypothetical protein
MRRTAPTDPRRKQRLLRQAAALGVVSLAALAVVAGAVTRADADPEVRHSAQAPQRVGVAAPTAKRTGCEKRSSRVWSEQRRGRNVIETTYPEIALCGTNSDDDLHPFGLNTIRAYDGNDRIFAANGRADVIFGHHGTDEARIDDCDRTYRVERLKTVGKCANTTGRGSALKSIRQAAYPSQVPTIQCQLETDPTEAAEWPWLLRFSEQPWMRARDTTAKVDWQFVGWSAYLFRLEGTEWVQTRVQTIWLWDWAYDEQVRAFPGNVWRSFSDNSRRFVSFNIGRQGGTYRALVTFRWYPTGNGRAHEEHYWSDHWGEQETDNKHESCTFPPATPQAAAETPRIRAFSS